MRGQKAPDVVNVLMDRHALVASHTLVASRALVASHARFGRVCPCVFPKNLSAVKNAFLSSISHIETGYVLRCTSYGHYISNPATIASKTRVCGVGALVWISGLVTQGRARLQKHETHLSAIVSLWLYLRDQNLLTFDIRHLSSRFITLMKRMR